ncbi:MAG TPA: hypothetical protein VK431_05720 [Nitrosopumilaceae archaeon]|nr:hypothetical protein [Nitrosopumilaceae archaeon]
MNKTIMASVAILVLVIGVGSNLLSHSAEAKGMPKCWLNDDGTVKAFYAKMLKGTTADKYPIDLAKTYCQYHKQK